MNESLFNDMADELMLAIEQSIDDCGADIDYESSGGVLTLTVEANNSVIVISRQPAIGQIWVAARSGGFHLACENNCWVCTATEETLQQLLSRVCSEQSGTTVELAF